MTAQALWEHVAALDSTVLVGLKEAGRARGVDTRGRSLVPKSLWEPLSQRVAALGVEVLYVEETLHPLVQLRLTGPAQIEALRRAPFVEYVEPASFDATGFLLEPGCGSSAPVQFGNAQAPGDIVPYTLFRHRVPQAWSIAPTAGAGVTVGVVDTGTSVYQPQLQSQFATGMSAGRTIVYDYTDPSGQNGPPLWHDSCGHGTKALGLIAAPRDGRSIVGVAYRANAYAVRALDDVYAHVGQWLEVREGIRRAAEASRIVSMAFGASTGNSGVSNTIRFYYHDIEYKRLFIGAAGSSTQFFTGMTYPSTLEEVMAVTGTTDGFSPCSGCNYGEKVFLVAYTGGESTGLNEGEINGFGKSSGATSVISGIAALVMSHYPNLSRDQVVERLRQAGSRSGSRDPRIGHGVVNAEAAVGGIKDVRITGPGVVSSSGTYTFTAAVEGGSGPFAYAWSSGGTGSGGSGASQTRSYHIATGQESYTFPVEVSVTDQSTGSTRTASWTVLVQGEGCGTMINC
ncbi:MAG: S8 family peptidase [Rubricoccaceae bacterium]